MQALVEAGLPVSAVLSNRADAKGLDFARQRGIATAVVEHRSFADRAAFEDALARQIDRFSPRLVVLAGFMRVLTAGFVARYRERMLNIHPSLLPSFPGTDAQRQAIDYGVKVSGATVHLVTPELDGGPIVSQRAVPVFDDDTAETLAARVRTVEHEIYPEAVERILWEPWEIAGRRVVFSGRS